MPGKPLRYGVIGCGHIHRNHAQAARLLDAVTLVGVADLDEGRVKEAAEEWGVPGYTDYHDLLEAGVDAVGVCLPHHLHAPVALDLARAGVHVLVEKPLAVSVDEADEMIATCDRHGVQLGVAFQNRFNDNVEVLRRLLRSGKLGRPVLGTATFEYYKSPQDTGYFAGSGWRGTWERDGGGVLNAHAVHALDLLLWLLGDANEVAAAVATLTLGTEVEDTGVGLLRFDNGALASVVATLSAGVGLIFELSISGTRGRAVLRDSRALDVEYIDGSRESHRFDLALDAPDYRTNLAYGRGHIGLLDDFAAAVAEGRPPRCDGRSARKTLAVVKSLYAGAGFAAEAGAKPLRQ